MNSVSNEDFDYKMDGQVNSRPTKRAQNISLADNMGNEAGEDQDINMGGSSGKGQGSTPNRGRTDDKNNRKLSCKECRRYVHTANKHY